MKNADLMFSIFYYKFLLPNQTISKINSTSILIIYKYNILEEQWNNWWLRSQICYDSMYVKIDGQFKTIKRIELTSDSKTILLHIETEIGTEEVYNCPSESPNYYHLRKGLSSEIYIPSDIVCGNEDFII